MFSFSRLKLSVGRTGSVLLNLFRLNSTGKMESDDDDTVLYYSHQKLKQMLMNKETNKDEVVLEYLKSLSYPPVKDFTPGLEWFNVSEPLSFKKHLKGKIVVLDFFTYCCINCMHIIPELREIEEQFSVEDGLVVIGVHSAKFENEKISANILAAVQRYNITHPVVNDHKSDMWKNCEVNCWPTLLILGPNANPIVMLMGEGHKENLRLYISNALKYYKSKNQISNHEIPFESAYHLLPDLKGPLLFPGKIANILSDQKEEILAVSDTGNHRIIIMKPDGAILHIIGGRAGFKDGSLKKAEFNAPQGVVFQNKDILYVADTENHAIRKIDLSRRTVQTVAGTGEQGSDRIGGNKWDKQEISSPWDLCIYRTPDMDMTFYPDRNPPLRDVLIIAMAGTHQIWALFLEETIWWKGKKYAEGTCVCIAGSGREENRNNQYPQTAGFAQPSGLALCAKNKEIYIADSESSTVRRLSLTDGKVTPVVGGDRNPSNLFSFGDKDGTLHEAKLQHLLGLAASLDEKSIYVADTYNHKLKKVDISKNSVVTLSGKDTTDGKREAFNEPAGLCVSVDGKKLYLADTNNHKIKVIKINENGITNVQDITLSVEDAGQEIDESKVIDKKIVSINPKGGKLVLKVVPKLEKGLKLTEDAPQKWWVNMPNATWSCVPSNGKSLSNFDVVINVPKCEKDSHENSRVIYLSFNLVTCTSDSCLPKNFIVQVLFNFNDKSPTSEKLTVNLHIEPSKVKVK